MKYRGTYLLPQCHARGPFFLHLPIYSRALGHKISNSPASGETIRVRNLYHHIITFAEMRRILDDSEKITSKLVNINIAKKVLKSQKYENRLNDIIKRLDLLRKNAIFIMLVRIMSWEFIIYHRRKIRQDDCQYVNDEVLPWRLNWLWYPWSLELSLFTYWQSSSLILFKSFLQW